MLQLSINAGIYAYARAAMSKPRRSNAQYAINIQTATLRYFCDSFFMKLVST